MNPKHYFTAILIIATIICTSCAPSRAVIYSVNSITPSDTIKTIPINVDVITFMDNRANIAENKVLFTNSRETIIDKKRVCINAEKYYNKAPVVNQMTQIFVKHVNKAQLFTHANYNENIDGNYYLTGTLNSFYGKQEFPTEAVANAAAIGGMLFGAIGGGIAAVSAVDAKTPGKIIIDISDLQLYRKDGTLVKDLGNFYREYTGNFEADAKCWCIYGNMNSKLRDFNTQLIEKIREEIVDVTFE
jgi:hypothetical protein